MNKKQITKILKDKGYSVLEYENTKLLIWVKIKGKDGINMFDLPIEFNKFIYSFEVYEDKDICIYLDKEVLK